jgi:hypothetical protein
MPEKPLTKKCSTIVISTGDRTRFYRSMAEVPSELRRQLERSTQGADSATILIADERGRKELVRTLRRESAAVEPRPKTHEPPAKRLGSQDWLETAQRHWLEAGVLAVIALGLWLLAIYK